MNKLNRFTSSSSSSSSSSRSTTNNNNSRFSVLDEPSVPKDTTNIKKERESNSFLNSNNRGNSRFESLKEDLVPVVNVSENNNNRNNSFRTNTVVKKVEPILQQINLKEDDFPDLISSCPKKTETSVNKWAAIVKKEVVVEVEEEEVKVAPGWISIRKNQKTGKYETIQGPLTEEQREYDRIRYLEQHDLKYNMLKTIERMSERWDEYKEQFDERYGPGAYNEKYGVDLYEDDSDDDHYDSESDSEYEYE
jgi:hypothetical protein